MLGGDLCGHGNYYHKEHKEWQSKHEEEVWADSEVKQAQDFSSGDMLLVSDVK